jgi:hypothetical protein
VAKSVPSAKKSKAKVSAKPRSKPIKSSKASLHELQKQLLSLRKEIEKTFELG